MEKDYQTEEEFLKDYDSSSYDSISVTTDILLLSISDKKLIIIAN